MIFLVFKINFQYQNLNFNCSDKVSTVDEETFEEIETSVRNKKIMCAATMIKAFINSSADRNEQVDFMGILNSIRL